MKNRLSLILLTLALAGFAASTANFTVDVKIGSASAGTSLTFGAGTAQEQPFPPISLMFGVKDVFLANPANVGETAGVTGDMSRLAVDVRAGATQWVIVANSDTTLYFDKSGAPKLYYGAKVEKDAETKTIEFAGGELGDSLSVSAGCTYTISTSSVTEANVAIVADDPANTTIYAYDAAGEGEFTGDWSGTSEATTIQVAATDEGLYFYDGSKYYGLNGSTSNTKPADATAIVTVDGATINSLTNYTVSISGNPSLNYEGTSTAKPFTTTVANGDTKLAAITWIIKTFGTLDFDGNGVVDNNDAIFFYNFVINGGSDAELSASDLMSFAEPTENLEAEAQTALDYLNAKEASLALDGRAFEVIGDLQNSAVFFYNYLLNGGREAELSPSDIMVFAEDTGNLEAEAQIALDTIQSLTDQ